MAERNAIEKQLKSWERKACCTFCGKKFITTKYKLEQGNVFCSRHCYAEYKKETCKGKNNPRYSEKVSVICDNCGAEFLKKPSLASITNSEGVNHNFCSKQCYWNYRKIYYVGDRLYNTGKKMSEEFCEKVRQATLRQYADGVLNKQTKPQIYINKLLDELDIPFVNEHTFKYYSVDNFLSDHNLIIEVMGDYFHANPLIYNNYNQLNAIQQKDVIRDKRKHTYISKYFNIEILYLWEHDIKTNLELCKQLILKYINNNGHLIDYNSFNYSIHNNCLLENQTKVSPYFIVTP